MKTIFVIMFVEARVSFKIQFSSTLNFPLAPTCIWVAFDFAAWHSNFLFKVNESKIGKFKAGKMLSAKGSLLPTSIRRLGSIRGAGGSMAKRGESLEEEYFYKQRQEQFNKLKQKKLTDKEFVAERIKSHQDAIEFHKRMIEEYKSGKKVEEVEKMNK